jgi:hypothetical protein
MAEAAEQLAILRESGVQHALVTVDLRETEQVPELIERFGSEHLATLQQK